MSALIGIKNPSEYSEINTSEYIESPAILNPVSARWYPSRGEPKLNIKDKGLESSPRAITQLPEKFYHPAPGRNALGLVGGNDVSLPSGNMVDVESELYGITRSLTRVPAKKYQPSCPLGDNTCPPWPSSFQYTERSSGMKRTISTKPRHLSTIQMFSYPGIPAPTSLTQQVYAAPWRF